MINYFTQAQPPFGSISWTMAVVWAVSLGVGAYLFSSYRTANPIRSRFVHQAALITAIISGLGLILLVLKFINVPVAEWRLWSYLVALAWLGYLGYTLYVYNSKLPALIATTKPTRTLRTSGHRGARTYAANGTPAPREPRAPRPVATTTRREARREKKRKGR